MPPVHYVFAPPAAETVEYYGRGAPRRSARHPFVPAWESERMAIRDALSPAGPRTN